MKSQRANLVLGQRIRELRIAKGWSQEELGARCNLDRTYVSGIERGVRNPTLSVVDAFAAGLGVTMVDLFTKSKGG
jgi:transcriptional regulator with XRE-family HTH domain